MGPGRRADGLVLHSLVLHSLVGGMPVEKGWRSMLLFAERVLPVVGG